MPPEPKETNPSKEKTIDEQPTDESSEASTGEEETLDMEGATEEMIELNDRLDSLSRVLDRFEQQHDDLRAQILMTLKSFKEENNRLAGKDGTGATDDEEPMQQC